MLNIIRERWPLFQKNWPSILFVALVQLWWGVTFPVITKLGAPWNIIMGLFSGVFGLWIALYVFLFPEKFAPGFTLSYLNKTASPKTAKIITHAVRISTFSAGMFIVWYKKWYGMSNSWYAMLYASSIMMFALIYRASSRYEASIQECE